MSAFEDNSGGEQPRSSTAGGLAAEQLVFGIIALQNNFITRDQLVTAFDAWVQDKSRRLVEILESLGALTIAHRRVLETLVEMFLAKHNGSPEKCLATLSWIPQVAPELEKHADPELLASLGHVALGGEATPSFRDFGKNRFRI